MRRTCLGSRGGIETETNAPGRAPPHGCPKTATRGTKARAAGSGLHSLDVAHGWERERRTAGSVAGRADQAAAGSGVPHRRAAADSGRGGVGEDADADAADRLPGSAGDPAVVDP